jgi:hypothetical protein
VIVELGVFLNVFHSCLPRIKGNYLLFGHVTADSQERTSASGKTLRLSACPLGTLSGGRPLPSIYVLPLSSDALSVGDVIEGQTKQVF